VAKTAFHKSLLFRLITCFFATALLGTFKNDRFGKSPSYYLSNNTAYCHVIYRNQVIPLNARELIRWNTRVDQVTQLGHEMARQGHYLANQHFYRSGIVASVVRVTYINVSTC